MIWNNTKNPKTCITDMPEWQLYGFGDVKKENGFRMCRISDMSIKLIELMS